MLGISIFGAAQPDLFGTDPFNNTSLVLTDPTVNMGCSHGRLGDAFISSSLSLISSVPVVGHSESSDTELTDETESHWTDSFWACFFLPVIRKLRAPRLNADPISLHTLPLLLLLATLLGTVR